jgi:hypothetical protein
MVYTGTEAWEESFMAMWVKMSKSAAAPEKALEANLLGPNRGNFSEDPTVWKLSPPHGPFEAPGRARTLRQTPLHVPFRLQMRYTPVTL